MFTECQGFEDGQMAILTAVLETVYTQEKGQVNAELISKELKRLQPGEWDQFLVIVTKKM